MWCAVSSTTTWCTSPARSIRAISRLSTPNSRWRIWRRWKRPRALRESREVGRRQGSAAHRGSAGKGAAGAEPGQACAQRRALARGTAGAAAAVPDDGQAGDVCRQRRRKRLHRQPAARACRGIRPGRGCAGGRDLRRHRGANGGPRRRGKEDFSRRHGPGRAGPGPPDPRRLRICSACRPISPPDRRRCAPGPCRSARPRRRPPA